MDSLPLPVPDDEALLRELPDLLGDLPEAPDDSPAALVVGPGAGGAPSEASAQAASAVPGRVADGHRPALAQMVRSLNERIAGALVAQASAPEVAARRYLTFSIGARQYGVPLENVVEIGRMPPVVVLPHVPGWLLGFANLRGQVIAVLDLACLLGAGEGRTDARRRLIVVRPSGGAVFGGVIVDEVHRIRDLSSTACRPAESAGWADPAYLTGFFVEDGEPLALLDMTRLLRSEALQQFAAQRGA